MKKGFTLVELSIVLVIVGLLIGGLLVGQAVMRSAAVNSTVSQIGKFDAMTMSFKSKYKYLPGDAPAFGGDGDGVLDWRGGGWNNLNDAYTCEMPNYWNNIDITQFKSAPCGFPSASTTVKAEIKGANKNVPAAKIGSAGSFFIANSMSDGVYNANITSKANFYIILHGSQLQNNTACGNRYEPLATTLANANLPLTVEEMMGLDAKMDDGIANAGNVLSGNITAASCSGYGSPYTSPIATCSSGASYATSSSGYQCTPLIRIGALTGEVQ